MVQKHISSASYTCMISLANIVSYLQKLYGWPHYCQILSIFLYDFSVGHWLANIMWCQAKTIGCIHLYFILDHKSKVNYS